jgi:hypothetical protein
MIEEVLDRRKDLSQDSGRGGQAPGTNIEWSAPSISTTSAATDRAMSPSQ